MRERSEGDSVVETEARATRWPLRVRYHECDAQGVVFNANYFAWADMGSTEFWRGAFGGYERLVAEGLETVVVAAEGAFRRPARFDELLEVETTVTAIGVTSFALTSCFRRDGEELATITVRAVFVDVRLEGKREPPPEVRAALERAAGA